MVTLRDGTQTEDARLARLEDFDERSRGYPIRELLKASNKPRSYTWNFWPDKAQAPLHQGSDSSCVGTAWTHECGIRPLATAKPYKFARDVYYAAQRIDEWDGGEYPGASPQYAGTSILAGAKVMHRMGWFREYRWAFDLEDLIMTLGYHGPAVVGSAWHYDMYFPDEWGLVTPTGDIYGGHGYVAASVNVTGRYIGFINSWGHNWGGGKGDLLPGWFKMSFENVEKLLKQHGEVCIPSTRRSDDFRQVKPGTVVSSTTTNPPHRGKPLRGASRHTHPVDCAR